MINPGDDDDNYSDVDWSDDAGSGNDEAQKSEGNDETLHIDIGASTSKVDDQKKRKRDIAAYTDEDRSVALDRHLDDLRTAYYRALLISKWCNDEFLISTLISLLPTDLVQQSFQKKNTNVEQVLSVANWFKKYFIKLKNTFLTADEGRDGCCAADLISDVIPNATGSAHQLNQLLVSLLRGLGFEVRYVRAIDPCSHKPNGHEDLTALAKTRAKKVIPGQNGPKAKWARGVIDQSSMTTETKKDSNTEIFDSSYRNKVIELLSDDEDQVEGIIDENKIISVKVKKEEIPLCWVEVYLRMPKTVSADEVTISKNNKSNSDHNRAKNRRKKKEGVTTTTVDGSGGAIPVDAEDDICVIDACDVSSEGRYVQIDLYNGGSKLGALIDRPKCLEVPIRSRKPVSYVVAVDATGLMIDVTSRYANNAGNTRKARMPEIELWEQLVNSTVIASTSQRRSSRKTNQSDHISLYSAPSSSSIINIDLDSDHDNAISDPSSSKGNGLQNFSSTVLKERNTLATEFTERNNRSDKIKSEEREKEKAARRLSQQLRSEQDEFNSLALKEPMPTTLSGFKNHHLFILERDIKGDKGVNPANTGARAGTFKEEIVYFQTAVEDLKTRHQWRMVMKDVIMRDIVCQELRHEADPTAAMGSGGILDPGNVGAVVAVAASSDDSSQGALPCSDSSSSRSSAINYKNSSSSSSSSGNDDVCDIDVDVHIIDQEHTVPALKEPIPPHKVLLRKRGDADVRIELYGAWQTVPYVVDPVKDGIIPVNKHGNVEVWDFNECLVPKGARLLQSRHAAKAAQSLGLPFAPALVGFENKGQYTAPKIGGAVVLSEHYFLLLEAVGNIQEDKEEKAEGAWEAKIVARWADLVRKALTRQRLKVQYGH